MITSLLDSKRQEEDIRRENRSELLKRCIIALLSCVALVVLGMCVYHIYHTLSRGQ
jgi:hypothetical protein